MTEVLSTNESEWVPLAGYEHLANQNNAPIKLTLAQLKDISASVPLTLSADSRINNPNTSDKSARAGVREWLEKQLENVKLCPQAIQELKETIIDMHYKGLVVVGTPIGITAAESVGATTIQITLNTFHASGSALSVGFGIEAIKDLIFARKKPKNESCTIFYKNKMSDYETVLNSRQYIVGSVIQDFIVDYDIDLVDNIELYPRQELIESMHRIPNSTYKMRLYFNLIELYKQKVSLFDICEALHRDIESSIYCVASPMVHGIIDIFPNNKVVDVLKKEKIIKENPANEDLVQMTFLESYVRPDLANIRVKGVAGIKRIFPRIINVWSVVSAERLVKLDDLNESLIEDLGDLSQVWVLFLNSGVIKNMGISDENLTALCEAAKIKVIRRKSDRIFVRMPDQAFKIVAGENVIKHEGQFFRNLSNLKEFNGLLYEMINKDNIKSKSNPSNPYYGIQVRAEITATEGWIETKIPALIELVHQRNILKIEDDYYREVKNVYRNFLPTDDYDNLTDLTQLITDRRIQIEQIKPSSYVLSVINKARNTYQKDVDQAINDKAKKANDMYEAGDITLEEKRFAIRQPVRIERSKIMKAAEFVIADTEGSNLKELLALPQIDKTRTTCNNIHTIFEIFGIEACLNKLTWLLVSTIANSGSYIHPVHPQLIAEMSCSRGVPLGSTFSGISRNGQGHLSLATLERASKVFSLNALFGRKEDTRNTSASVIVGARIEIGDGYCNIAQDVDVNGTTITYINEDMYNIYKPEKGLEANYRVTGNETMTEYHQETANDDEDVNMINFKDDETVPTNVYKRQAGFVRRYNPGQDLFPIDETVKVGVVSNNPVRIGEGIKPVQKAARLPIPILSSGLRTPRINPNNLTHQAVPTELRNLINKYQHKSTETQLPRVAAPRVRDISGLPAADRI